jgi:hypothetical protein
MAKFIVEGRRFAIRNNALTYAAHQAKTLERAVKVEMEVEVAQPVRVERKWIATINAPGTQVTTAIKQPLNVRRRA